MLKRSFYFFGPSKSNYAMYLIQTTALCIKVLEMKHIIYTMKVFLNRSSGPETNFSENHTSFTRDSFRTDHISLLFFFFL